jgi:hypothetical protein
MSLSEAGGKADSFIGEMRALMFDIFSLTHFFLLVCGSRVIQETNAFILCRYWW